MASGQIQTKREEEKEVRRQRVRKEVTKILSIHERMLRENVQPIKRNKESMTHNKKVDKPGQANSLPSSSDTGMSGVVKNLLCRTDAEEGTIKVIRLDSTLLERRSMTEKTKEQIAMEKV